MHRVRTIAGFGLLVLLVGLSGYAGPGTRPAATAVSDSAIAPAVSPPPEQGKTYRIPYRLSETLHMIVRAKLNGKGPFNFIVDTGAPAMFVTTATVKEASARKDDDGWTVFDRMELEGGAVIVNAKARAEDIFQIRGMNSLNLPGVRLDGVLGYNILARYRMAFDLSKNSMNWTELAFDPPLPEPLRGEGGGAPPELEMIGNLMQGMGSMLRRPDAPPAEPRGLLGVHIRDHDQGVTVTAVLPDTPAQAAGIKPDDRIVQFNDVSVRSAQELLAVARTVGPGDDVQLQIQRGRETMQLNAKLTKGF